MLRRYWRLEAGSWELEAGSWKLEAGSWKLGFGSWKYRDCRLETEGRGLRSDVVRPNDCDGRRSIIKSFVAN
jgi:hypothetical protein